MRVLVKVPYFVPWISREDKKSVVKVLNQRWLTNGPVLKKFEAKFSEFIKTKYSVGVSSATHALHLITKCLDLKPDDEVIVPTFTFVATANAVIYCGAKLVLADIDSDTFNISIKDIQKKITKKTRAIIAVHYGGQSCDMDKLQSLGKQKNLSLIEDCAHALGSTFRNQLCGSFGIGGCFSFYPTKIITTGEGGMITTNNKTIANRLRSLRSQAMNVQAIDREKKSQWKYDIGELGYNYRLDEIRSSLGLSQLKRINQINKKRQKIAKIYDKKLQNITGITIPYIKEDRNHIYHLYTIKIEKEFLLSRDELFTKLSEMGIGSSVQYYPLHLMSYMKNYTKFKKSDFVTANILKDKVLSLPIYPTMNSKQIEYICSIFKKA